MKVKYSLAISEENLGDYAPVLLQGGIVKSVVRASEIGFDSVELHIRKPESFNAEELLEIACRYNIAISAIGTGLEYSLNGLSLTSRSEQVRNEMAKRLKGHIDIASRLGAVVFLGLCRGKSPSYSTREEYLNRLEKELIPIVSYALKRNVVLALEPIVFYLTNLLNTTEETLEFLDRPGLEPVQLLLDTHHMFIEDNNMYESFRLCRGRIAHIHISDSNRRYPGCGNIDYIKVSKTLSDIGYDRTLSLEVLPYPSGDQAAVRGYKAMKSWSNCSNH